jgi:methylglutaconyl-CoA hydratase
MTPLRPRLFTPLLRAHRRCLRAYSAQSEPLITTHLIPAPSTGHIRILTLNRPSARNAISRALLSELQNSIRDIASQYDSNLNEVAPQLRMGGAAGEDKHGPTRALVIASAVDTSFCAGADLKERKGFSPEEYV